MEYFSSDDFSLLKELDYKIYTLVCKSSDPRFLQFINIPSSDFLIKKLSNNPSSPKYWYDMCIAVPCRNDCLSFFNGMRRDNHDKKHLFIDI